MHATRTPTIGDIGRFLVSRFYSPVTLGAAIEKRGYVQAEPIRAPARAQDLMLRHRVHGYRAGDLERLYFSLPVQENVFINYGLRESLAASADAPAHPAWRAGKGSPRVLA